MRNVVAVIVGVVVAFLVIMLVEALGHLVYPPPADLDFTDTDRVREYVAGLPAGAILFVVGAWLFGAFDGAFVSAWISGTKSVVGPAVVTVLVLAGSVANMILIPHPVWAWVLAIVGLPIAGWAGWRLAPHVTTPAGQ